MAKKTQEEYEKEVYEKTNGRIISIEPYNGMHTKIKYECLECGHIWSTEPSTIYYSTIGCPECTKRIRGEKQRTKNEDYKKSLSQKSNGTIITLEPYITSKVPILFKCLVCNHEWRVEPNGVLTTKNRGCPECGKKRSSEKQRKSDKKFRDDLFKLVGNEYTTLQQYVNNKTPILTKHDIETCGYEWSPTPSSLLQEHRCPKCSGNLTKTQQEFEDELFKLTNGEFEVVGEYINCKSEIKIKHLSCNKEFNAFPSVLLRKPICPYCKKKSNGETIVENYLIRNRYNYDPQYRISDCKNTFTLPFDFAILDTNGNLLCLIEYQGEQHYKPVRFRGISEERAKNNFNKTIINDAIKKDYCLQKNITLIEIPYWDFSILKEVLDREIGKYLTNSQIVFDKVVNV